MHFLSEDLEDYVAFHSQNEPELLAQLNKETYQKILLPRMLSGHFQGRVLSMLSKLIRPISILEIGTYTGYATLCLCEGMRENGMVHTIDIKEELVDFQRKYFDKSQWGSQIVQHLGEAIDVIPTIETKFDLVFIDADKINYSNYFDLVIDKVKKGGFILADNVLYHGEVLSLEKASKNAKAMHAYNEKILNDKRVESVLLPLRDGVMITRKK